MRDEVGTDDPNGEIKPFLGKAKELPERTQQIVRQALSEAKPVEGMGTTEAEPCPVCSVKVDGSLVAVAIPGRRSELIPRKLVHMVLSHDFWHPSMDILVQSGGRTFAEPPPENGSSDVETDGARSEDEVVERKAAEPSSLPFSDQSEEMVEGFEVDISSILSGRDVRRPRRSPAPRVPPSTVDRRSSTPGRARSDGATRHLPAPRKDEMSYRGAPDSEADQICRTYGISSELSMGLSAIARAVGAHPFDLANLVNFESAFNPSARGPSDVGATGLIQWIPSSARVIGTTTDALRRMTAEQQLPYVRKYLDRIRGQRRLDTPQKLYMAVFYPDAMDWPVDKEFPENVVRANTYQSGDEVVSIRTPADYMRRVEKRAKLPPSATAGPASTNPLEAFFSFVSSLLPWSTGQEPPAADSQSSAEMASWTVGPGVSAVLIDEGGKEWPPGRVPAGKYRLLVSGKPPSEVRMESGRSYRASTIGKMFGDVVEGG